MIMAKLVIAVAVMYFGGRFVEAVLPEWCEWALCGIGLLLLLFHLFLA